MPIRVKLKRGIVLNTPGFGGVRNEQEHIGPINVKIDEMSPRQEDNKPSYRILKEQTHPNMACGCYLYPEDTLPYIKTVVVINRR